MKSSILLLSLLIGTTACGSADQKSNQTTTEQTEAQQTVTQKPKVENINQKDFDQKKAEDNVIVIDVRTADEVSNGYIEGADLFIDFYGDFETGIANLDKDKTYLMYCRSGGRSGSAAQIMVDKGFKTVYNLTGGISRYSGTVVKD
jgi:rhodanese-related sulfurtransferase